MFFDYSALCVKNKTTTHNLLKWRQHQPATEEGREKTDRRWWRRKQGKLAERRGRKDYIHLYVHHTGYEREYKVLQPDPNTTSHTSSPNKLSWHPINRKLLALDGILSWAAALAASGEDTSIWNGWMQTNGGRRRAEPGSSDTLAVFQGSYHTVGNAAARNQRRFEGMSSDEYGCEVAIVPYTPLRQNMYNDFVPPSDDNKPQKCHRALI